MNIFNRTLKRLNKFWFESENYEQMILFRALFGWVAFALYSIRALDLKLFYSQNGIMSLDAWSEVSDMHYRISLLNYFSSDLAIVVFHTLYLVFLVLFALGVMPRLVSILCFIFHVSFVRRDIAAAYGVDFIVTYFLFYFIFADFRKTGRKEDAQRWLGSAAFRLSQIQVCIIYFFSGFEKVKGPLWWQGTALWNVFANNQIARWDLGFLAHWPSLIYFMTLLTVLWESYFPALIWVKPIRYPVLLVGVLLHLGIATTILLPFFGILMIVTYSLFLEPEHAAFLQQLVLKSLKFPQVRAPSTDRIKV